MAHKLLEALDREYKEKRAELIAANYDSIVGEIHHLFQTEFLNKVSDCSVQEIIKFDYMTNIKEDGDKHLWVHFIDKESNFHRFKIVVCSKRGSYIIFEDQKYSFDAIGISLEEFEKFSNLTLDVFRRGYDKP